MISGGLRETLTAVLHEVVERRFGFYGFEVWPLELEPTSWAVEVRRVRAPAPAMGTIAELADILEKYLWAKGMKPVELVKASAERMAFVVEVAG